MSGQDLLEDLKKLENMLFIATNKYEEALKERAKAEHDYKVKLLEIIFIFRTEGYELNGKNTGQIAITACENMAKGHPDVAELRLKRDIAEASVKATYERINTLKYNIKAKEILINIELGLTKGQI